MMESVLNQGYEKRWMERARARAPRGQDELSLSLYKLDTLCMMFRMRASFS
jgi:hypothetical protein